VNNVEAKILSYPHLQDDEQEALEAYVETHPEWASLLEDVRAIESAFAPPQSAFSDDFIATYVTVRHVHPDAVPPKLQEMFTVLEAALEEHPALRRKADAARARLREAESALDPAAHFEALTDHRLGEATDPADATTAPAQEDGASAPQDAAAPSLTLDDTLRLPLIMRWAGAVVVALGLVYGGLYGASRMGQSTLDRLAAVEVSDQVVESYNSESLRGPAPPSRTTTPDAQYLEALSRLRAARTTTFGLFPRYVPEELAAARTRFRAVLEAVEPRSFLALESHFYLGKIALAQERLVVARRHFSAVVRGENRRAEDAYQILKVLQQEYAPGAP
jgi:hypothetical protein